MSGVTVDIQLKEVAILFLSDFIKFFQLEIANAKSLEAQNKRSIALCRVFEIAMWKSEECLTFNRQAVLKSELIFTDVVLSPKGVKTDYPFGGEDVYNKEIDSCTLYKNPLRLKAIDDFISELKLLREKLK